MSDVLRTVKSKNLGPSKKKTLYKHSRIRRLNARHDGRLKALHEGRLNALHEVIDLNVLGERNDDVAIKPAHRLRIHL